MKPTYKIIHIDTEKVTMCEKITIDGNDYYYDSDIILSDDVVIYNNNLMDGINNEFIGIIATTNTSLQCPQVVDYVEELCRINCSKMDSIWDNYKKGFCDSYELHSETHILSDDEVVQYSIWLTTLNKFTEIVKHIDFNESDSYIANELLNVFKSTLPTKVYYR